MAKRRKIKPRFWLVVGVGLALVIILAVLCLRPMPGEKQPTIKVYFIKNGDLAPVERPIKANEAPLPKAINELLAGPTPEEKGAGFATQIPEGTRLLNLHVKDRVAIVDLNRKLERYGGGSARLEGLVAQIVYTATEIPGVNKAWIWLEGEKELVLGGEGLVLDRPLNRRDVSE